MRQQKTVCISTVLMIAVLCVGFSGSALAAKAGETREPPVNKKLRRMIASIDLKTFGGKSDDVKRLKSLSKSAPTEKLKIKAASFLARHYLQNERAPASAVEVLLPFVISRAAAKAWKKENKAAYEVAVLDYKTKLKHAKKAKRKKSAYPEKPSTKNIFAALLPASKWTVTPATARAVIVLSLVLAQQGQHNAALTPLQKSGEVAAQTLAQILAAEAAGDLFGEGLGQWEKAVGFYETALAFQKRITSGIDSYGNKVDTSENLWGEDLYYKQRVQKKLRKAMTKRDENRFGAGYVAFRRAERFRRQDRDFPSAFVSLKEVEEAHPQTIWSEAATAYRIKTLLILATMQPTQKTTLTKRVKNMQRDIKNLKIALKIMQMKKIDKTIITEMKKLIAEEKQELARLKATPYGEPALKAAMKLAKSFLAARELGLYRGEVMLAMGHFYLQNRVDMKSAGKWYTKLAAWLERAPAADAAQDAFIVPPKAQEVAASPTTEKKLDMWGNAVKQNPQIGAIVHRKSATWYMQKLSRDLRLHLGVVKFIGGDLKGAAAAFQVLLETDKFIAARHAKGWPNAFKRLQEDCQRGFFWGWAKDLKAFKGKKRSAVFLAGFYFESADNGNAKKVYESLVTGKFGKLSTKESAFVQQGLGEVNYRTGDFKAAADHFKRVAEKYRGTPTGPRGMLSLGSAYLQLRDQAQAIKQYEKVWQEFPKTEAGEKGLYYAGFVQATEKLASGEKALKLFLKKYPKSIYTYAAKQLLAEYKARDDEMRNNQNDNKGKDG